MKKRKQLILYNCVVGGHYYLKRVVKGLNIFSEYRYKVLPPGSAGMYELKIDVKPYGDFLVSFVYLCIYDIKSFVITLDLLLDMTGIKYTDRFAVKIKVCGNIVYYFSGTATGGGWIFPIILTCDEGRDNHADA